MSDQTLGERIAEKIARDEMEAMIAQRYCEHIKLLDAKVERLVADKERELRDAWEAGIKLARSYHDNIIFLEGEQKEWQWQKFRAALAPAGKTEDKG